MPRFLQSFSISCFSEKTANGSLIKYKSSQAFSLIEWNKSTNEGSLLCFSKNIEGILYDVVETRMKEKQSEYDTMHLQTIEQIYGAIEANIEHKYKFNKNTVVFVMNCITENCSRLQLTPEICKQVNNIHQFEKGSFLYSKIVAP